MDRKEMDKNSDIKTMRDMAGNIGHRNRKKRINPFLNQISTGFIVIVCLVVLFAIFSGSCGKEDNEEINSIKGRLDQIEEKVSQYVETGNKIHQLESQVKQLQNSVSKSDKIGTTLRSEIETIGKQVESMKKEFSSITSKTKLSGTVRGKTNSQVKGNYHEVQLGDTLYWIANKYGLSVEELCSMNNISKEQSIHPGQKIIIK